MMNATQVFLTIVALAVIVAGSMLALLALLGWLEDAFWRRANKHRLEAQDEQEPQEPSRLDLVLAISGLDEFQAGLAEIEAAFERIAEKGAAIELPITINNHYNIDGSRRAESYKLSHSPHLMQLARAAKAVARMDSAEAFERIVNDTRPWMDENDKEGE